MGVILHRDDIGSLWLRSLISCSIILGVWHTCDLCVEKHLSREQRTRVRKYARGLLRILVPCFLQGLVNLKPGFRV